MTFILKIITNPKIYKPLIAILIGLSFYFLWVDRNAQKKRADIQTENVTVLQTKPVITISKSGDTISTVGILNQTISELKQNKSDLIYKIDDLNIKLSHVTSVGTGESKGSWSNKAKLTTDTIHDTINHTIIIEKIGIIKDSCLISTFTIISDTIKQTQSIKIPIFYAIHTEKTGNWRIKNLIIWRDKTSVMSAKTLCPNIKLELHQTDIK
jgi:hypothetical protein